MPPRRSQPRPHGGPARGSRGRGSARRTAPSKRHERAETPELPEYLRRLGLPPRKALGQHFLVDEFILGDIADAAALTEADTVLEIGAGPGGLTEELTQRAGQVVAVELDEELAALTRSRLEDAAGLTVLAADILDFAPIELLDEAGVALDPDTGYVAVGNLPYYITQPIVRRLLEADPGPTRIVVLVQREVARRMVGGEGRESLLSMSIKVYGEPRLLFHVPASAFWPAPKVQSAVVSIERRPELAVDLPPEELTVFFHLLRAGFASPRKQIHNAFPAVLGLSNDEVTATIEAAGLDAAARAQHLDLADWERLYRAFRDRHPESLDVA